MINYDDFFKFPIEVQRGFVTQFRKIIDVAIDCGTYYEVFGDSITCSQFKTILEIVRRFDNGNSKS